MFLPEHVMEQLEELLDLDPGTLRDGTVLAELEGWDSVNQMRILVRLEKLAARQLDFEAFVASETVGDLLAVLLPERAGAEGGAEGLGAA
jgi:acyl carrier protein